MKELTDRQKQILDFIRHRQDFEKLTPTLREIAAHFRFSSPNAAQAHVQALRAKGFLKTLPGRARSLQVLAGEGTRAASGRRMAKEGAQAGSQQGFPGVISVPIYGAIPAGRPDEAAQEQEGCVLIDVDTLGIKP